MPCLDNYSSGRGVVLLYPCNITVRPVVLYIRKVNNQLHYINIMTLSKNQIYSLVALGILALGIGAYMIFSGTPTIKEVAENMNRDIAEFRVETIERQQQLDEGTFTEEEQAEYSANLAAFGEKMVNYRAQLGESWADFSARFGSDLTGFTVKLTAVQAELAKGNLSAEARAELVAQLDLMTTQVQEYQNEIQ